jgi:chemotaxis protein MotB
LAKLLRKPKVKKSEQLWMATFADMSLILLCLFALLISMSTINTQKFDNVTSHLKSDENGEVKKVRSLKELKEIIERKVNSNRELKQAVEVRLDTDGLAVEFKSHFLFASGSARPNPQYTRLVQQVLAIIASAPKKYDLSLEGHTDDAQLSGRGLYPSNWELSSARSISLLNALGRSGVDSKRMSVQAFADTRPKVEFRNKKGAQLERARASNRRVVIRMR